MAVLLANNAATTLAGSIDDIQTTIAVSAGDGALFPSPGAGDYFPLTLVKVSGGNLVREVVRCTSRSTDTLTVVRAQEGTSATNFGAGDRAELRLTAGAYDDLKNDYQALDDTVQQSLSEFEAGNFTRYDLASISTTATLDLATGNEFAVDASTARTLTFANVPTGRSMTVVLSITGASAITWPAGIRWHEATAPELGASWTIVVMNYDGANWSGVLGASA